MTIMKPLCFRQEVTGFAVLQRRISVCIFAAVSGGLLSDSGAISESDSGGGKHLLLCPGVSGAALADRFAVGADSDDLALG